MQCQTFSIQKQATRTLPRLAKLAECWTPLICKMLLNN